MFFCTGSTSFDELGGAMNSFTMSFSNQHFLEIIKIALFERTEVQKRSFPPLDLGPSL